MNCAVLFYVNETKPNIKKIKIIAQILHFNVQYY